MAYTDIKFRVVLETSQAKQGLQEVEKAGEKVGTAIQKIGSTSGQTGSVMMGLTRVVQDSRYGFIGVYNNITQVIDSMTYLNKTTGSLKGSMSLVWQSMMGPAGIMIAFQAMLAFLPEVIGFFTNTSNNAKLTKEQLKELETQLNMIKQAFNGLVSVENPFDKMKYKIDVNMLQEYITKEQEEVNKLRIAQSGDFTTGLNAFDVAKLRKTKTEEEIQQMQDKALSTAKNITKENKEQLKYHETVLTGLREQQKLYEAQLKIADIMGNLGVKAQIEIAKGGGGQGKGATVKTNKLPFLDITMAENDVKRSLWLFEKQQIEENSELASQKWEIEKARLKEKLFVEEENERTLIVLEKQRLTQIENMKNAWLGLGDTMANVFSQMGGDLNKVGSTMQKIMQVMRIIQQMEASQKMLASGDISKEGNIINQITGFLEAFGAGTSKNIVNNNSANKNIVNNSGSTTVAVNIGGETVNKIMINNSSMISKRKVQLGVA